MRQPRGPGFWKFNSSLLEDSDYTATMTEKIPQFIDKYKDLEDKRLLWEMIKMEIRSFRITFTKTKAKKCRDQETFLTKEAERLQNLVDSQPTPEHINERMIVKSKLEKISFDQSRGACIRSKTR